jgi:hypothetical protein
VSLRQEGTAEFWEREQAVGREKRGAESRRERAGAGGREREQAGESGSRRAACSTRVRSAGLEPATPGSEDQCSIH